MSFLDDLLRGLFRGGQTTPAPSATPPAARAPVVPPPVGVPAAVPKVVITPAIVPTVAPAMPGTRGPNGRATRGGEARLHQGFISSVTTLEGPETRPAVPYWQVRRWRHMGNNVYLGYYKTRLGSCHGVIKWTSRLDFGFYVHDVPAAILNGPHGACFTEVKPGKFRVHFAQLPADLGSGIFYIETLLQEAFAHA